MKKVSFGKILLSGIIGGVIAAIINSIIYLIAQKFNGGSLFVTLPGTYESKPLSIFAVIIFSIALGLVAGLIYGFLNRFISKSRLVFLIIAALVFIGFNFPPRIATGFYFASKAAASTEVVFYALALMHLGAAVPIIVAILKAK